MSHRVHRKSNDGNYTGLKQDKFRNSDFEYNENDFHQSGMTQATPNTINGKWAENRGRRGGEGQREENPFENGKLYNWNHRETNFRGKGPKGYVRQDERIYEHVCEFLTRDTNIDAGEVEVKVESGVVTLTGKVEDRGMKKYAAHLIEYIPGVRDIHNLLEFDRR